MSAVKVCSPVLCVIDLCVNTFVHKGYINRAAMSLCHEQTCADLLTGHSHAFIKKSDL